MSTADLVAVVRSYLERALREVAGMKVLLLDAETTRIVSTALSQSDILEQEVYLVERLDADKRGDQLFHLRAVAYLRPTRENIARLRRELRDPRFGSYHVFFTNRVEDMRLQDLAEGDSKELVAGVQEFYSDFIALEAHHVAVPLPRPHLALTPMAWDFGASSDMLARLTEGVAALLLSLRRRFAVRFQHGSEIAERLAQTLHHLTSVEQRELFDFGGRGGEAPPLLLIIDRRDDPVTPLLSQWTYQAMVHELLCLRDNRVSLAHVAGVRADAVEAVLSPSQDPFFARNMYSNFGDLGMAVKGLVDAFSSEGRQARDFQSIDDMASFVEALPELTHQQGLVYRHVTLMSELSHAVERRGLMRVSGVEQEVVCQAPAVTAHHEAAASLVRSPTVQLPDKVRVAALYALRYGRDGQQQVATLQRDLAESGADPAALSALHALLKHCPADKRVMDLFSDRSISSRFASLAKQHLKGVENVYTQHTPPLAALLERAGRGKLADLEYPRVDNAGSPAAPRPPKLVVVFIVGGTTYEEAKAVAELNTAADRGEGWAAGMRFILAGTGVQNSTTMLQDFQELALMERYRGQQGGQR